MTNFQDDVAPKLADLLKEIAAWGIDSAMDSVTQKIEGSGQSIIKNNKE